MFCTTFERDVSALYVDVKIQTTAGGKGNCDSSVLFAMTRLQVNVRKLFLGYNAFLLYRFRFRKTNGVVYESIFFNQYRADYFYCRND